ncbi:MAG: DUF3800 domain-containing protein [Candidatus Nanopelagicales bacterium]
MLLAYIDESYSKSKYYIAALIVHDRDVMDLSDRLDAVVADAVRSYPGVPRSAELHGHDLFQAKCDWSALDKMVRARIGVYAKAFTAISSFDVAVIIRGLDRDRQKARYSSVADPHSVVLEHLLERVDQYAREHNERVLVISDEIKEQEAHRGELRFYREFSTSGYRARKISHVVDTIYFAPSRATRLLQAVDMIAFLHHRIETHTTGADERAVRANDALWQRIAPRVHHVHCWIP